MTHTVTLLADHKGNNAPKVVGDEYLVRAKINITAYRDATVTSTINYGRVAETITYASGTALTQPVVGRHLTLGSSVTSGNDGVKLVTAATATVITLSLDDVAADATNDEITITPSYELLNCADFGLSTFSSLKVIGAESLLHQFAEVVGTDGETTLAASSTTMELGATVMSTGANAAVSDLGYIVVEVTGSL